MDKLTCRLLPFEVADGPTNMATDEALLKSAAAGIATLRFYGWSSPTLSLGYFQGHKTRQADPVLAVLPFVRRASGGATLVHHHELTYALALPPGPWQQGVSWLGRMHSIIAEALGTLGVACGLYEPAPTLQGPTPLCFHHFTAGDVMVEGAKVVGSAQRKHRGAILQHGGILLARSQYTPSLPGISELTGLAVRVEQAAIAVQSAFEKATAARLIEQELTETERDTARALRTAKYMATGWNEKRRQF